MDGELGDLPSRLGGGNLGSNVTFLSFEGVSVTLLSLYCMKVTLLSNSPDEDRRLGALALTDERERPETAILLG